MKLDGKVIVVTGGGSGMGRELTPQVAAWRARIATAGSVRLEQPI